MKKNWLVLIIAPIVISCQNSGPLEFVPYSFITDPTPTNVDRDEELYYQQKDFSPIVTARGEYKYMKEFLKDNRDNRTHALMDTKGDNKMLVLPIRFADSPNDISLEDKTILLKNAFFGDSSVTKLESVTSFYNKSSYGQLRISGEVAPWYTVGSKKVSGGIPEKSWTTYSTNQIIASRMIALEALENYRQSGVDLSIFDNNNDGYIDSIYVVYDYPYSTVTKDKKPDDEFRWAYVDFIKEKETGLNNQTPYANAYGWSSLYFAIENGNKVDSSTYIHETGHILGLQDYYNTGNRATNHFQPLGFFDLMDSNQGDHTVLSKYLLNWTSPKILKKDVEGSITLNNFSNTGDCLLIPLDNRDVTNPYSEYLMLEYFAPERLNTPNNLKYQDVNKEGKTVIFEFPNLHGLKVYHVDARLGYYKRESIGIANEKICFVGEEEKATLPLNNALIDFYYSNEIKDTEVNKRNVLYHLLESSGSNSFRDGNFASNKTLWGYGDTFGINTFQDLANRAGVTFKVTSLMRNNVTVSFTKIAK